jgi:peroxiredoxin
VKNLKDQSFVLIGVHVGGLNAKQLKEVMDKEKLPWRSFVDVGNAGAGTIARKWDHNSTPTFFLIDHKGVIRFKWVGVPGEKVLDAALDKLITAVEGKGRNPAK